MCQRLPCALFEGIVERAIATIAALRGQLFGVDDMPIGHSFLEEADKMVDAQTIDISIIRLTPCGEKSSQIGSVGAYDASQLWTVVYFARNSTASLLLLQFFAYFVSVNSPRAKQCQKLPDPLLQPCAAAQSAPQAIPARRG